MEHRSYDIFNVNELHEILDRFDGGFDLPFSFVDPNGDVFTSSGWSDMVSIFHCIERMRKDTSLNVHARSAHFPEYGNECSAFEFKNGLVAADLFLPVEGSYLTARFVFFSFENSEEWSSFTPDEMIPVTPDVFNYSSERIPCFSKDDASKKIGLFRCLAELLIHMGSQDRKLNEQEARMILYEKELASNKEEMMSLEKMKADILSRFSHELKTPLSIIKGYNELLYDGCLGQTTESQKNALDTSIFNINKLERIIDSLVYVGMEHSDGHFYEYNPLNILDVIEAASVNMERSLAIMDQILEIDVPEIVPFIHGDSKKLLQALVHLLDNAIKFSPAGSTITISVAESDDRLLLSVQDRGIGIFEDKICHIFDDFYQGDGTLTRKYPGVGLGLNICQRIIQRHDGNIRVESKVDEGSTFHIDLPIKERLTDSMYS
ncbi:HAMP domain-containing sensor histidine kinase [Methanolobus sp. WCC4]|uniref:sensor histidine kinase n=1 Tax=Methanolobus sp. WCC4 TaxID=3125784 RepID=UPI0030F88AF0